jgi:hypothetical protein
MVCDKLPCVIGVLLSCQGMLSAVEAPSGTAAVIHAARAYRVEIYQNFRHDRARYDELRQLDAKMNERWSDAGRPVERAPEVVQWYAQARSAIASKQTLPALLELPPQTATVEAPVQATPAAVSVPVNNVSTPTPSTTTPANISPGATKPVSHTTTQPFAGSRGVGQAIGRALWNASVQTFAGTNAL